MKIYYKIIFFEKAYYFQKKRLNFESLIVQFFKEKLL